MSPLRSWASPNSVLKTVDFPAPFAPISVVTLPVATNALKPFRMVREP
jgi:hypothetical protein